VFEEASILCRDECVYDMRRQIVKSHENAASFADFRYQVAIATEDAQGYLQRNIPNRLRPGQAGLHAVIGADNGGDPANRRRNAEPERHNERPQHAPSPFVTWILVCFPWFMHIGWRFPPNVPVIPGPVWLYI